MAVVLPAHGFVDDASRCSIASTACSSAAARTSIPRPTERERHPLLGPDVDRRSDEYELALLRAATARDLPVLAICRGMQALNVSRGGTLHQHLPDVTELDHRQSHAGHEAAHAVESHDRLTAAPHHGPPHARGQHAAPSGDRRPRCRARACARTRRTGRSRPCTTRACASASASSGTPSC